MRILLFSLTLGFHAILFSEEPSRARVKAFVQKVVLGSEYPTGQVRAVARWNTAPTLSVFGATSEQKAVVVEVVDYINPTLRDLVGEIKVLPDNSDAAQMKVYFAPQAHFSRITARHKVRYHRGNVGYFWFFHDDKRVITSSGVLLASDRLSGPALRHVAFEEIVQSLGLGQDTHEFPDSIFFEKGPKSSGTAVSPSVLDMRLLRWTYEHLSPGDTPKDVSEKFEKTWGR